MSEGNERDRDSGSGDDEPSVMGVIGDTVRQIIPHGDADAAEGKDLPDDASGVEVPQDGDPAR